MAPSQFPVRHPFASAALALMLSVVSAGPALAQGPMGGGERHAMSAERMAAAATQRLEALKTKLALRADQEPAWAQFSTAITARPGFQRPTRAEMEAMTTPQRIDRLRELRNQRNTWSDQRGEAVKAFYGTLTSEQQKVFDGAFLKRLMGGPHRHGAPR